MSDDPRKTTGTPSSSVPPDYPVSPHELGYTPPPPFARPSVGTLRASTGKTPPPFRAPVAPTAVTPPAQVSMWHLLWPKWLTARAKARTRSRGHGARLIILGTVGAGFWALLFGIVYRILTYFKHTPEIGTLLAGKLLGLILVSFFSLLLLSNIITSLSTLFLARDLDLVATAPIDWLRLYGAKLVETTVNSSWMVALMAIPIFAAYGVAYNGGWWYPLIALAAFVPFMVIPAAMGVAITTVLVNVFPARRTREILSLITVLAAAAVVLILRLVRPEQLARPEGFQSLVEFIAVLRTPTSPWLPSEWVQSGVLHWLQYENDWFPFYMLWTTAGAFVVMGAALHSVWYAVGFSKAQESGGAKTSARVSWAGRMLRVFGLTRQELLLKEGRLFLRDTTQWSQLILLGVLVVVYVFNVRFLPLRGTGASFFLVNIIPFLNLALAGFVLASVAARFIFPSVSLEGRTWWLLRSSPLSLRDLLWAKYWIGVVPLLVLALAIVGTTGALLHISRFMMVVSVGTITLMTLAIGALALGLGTLFPQFETENAAQIPTSFGGLVFMMVSVVLIGLVLVLEARPVYSYLSAQSFGTPIETLDLVAGFGGAVGLCLTATFVPIYLAVRRLNALER